MYIDILKHYDFTDKFKSLSNEEKKQLGFHIYDDGSICYFKDIDFTLPNDREFGISFELEIDKDGNPSYYLLDTNFGQPVCGELKPGTQYCYDVETQTKAIIEDLIAKGVIEKTSDYEEPIIVPVDNSQPEEIKDKEVHWGENGTFGGIIKGESREDVEYEGSYEDDYEPDWYIGVSHNKEEALKLLYDYFPIEKTTWYRVGIYNEKLDKWYLSSNPDYPNDFKDQLSDLPFLADIFETEDEANKAIIKLMENCKLKNLGIEPYLFDNGYHAKIESYEDNYCSLDENYIKNQVDEAYTKNYQPKQEIKIRTEFYSFKILSDDKMKELGYTQWGHSWIKYKVLDLKKGIVYKSIIEPDGDHYEYIVQSLGNEDEVKEVIMADKDIAIMCMDFIDKEIKLLVENGIIKN